jgi:hypothetical protein
MVVLLLSNIFLSNMLVYFHRGRCDAFLRDFLPQNASKRVEFIRNSILPHFPSLSVTTVGIVAFTKTPSTEVDNYS